MNRKYPLFYALLFVVAAVTGCASSPVERQQGVAKSLADVKNDMVDTRTQVDKTLTSLDTLLHTAPGGVAQAYTQYAADVAALKGRADEMRESREQLREHRDDWLTAWNESSERVQNPELQQISEQRQNQIARRFDRIKTSFDAATEALTPLIQSLDDVRIVVGNDLTRRGVNTVADTSVAQNAYAKGTEVGHVLSDAIDNIDSLASVLEPVAER